MRFGQAMSILANNIAHLRRPVDLSRKTNLAAEEGAV